MVEEQVLPLKSLSELLEWSDEQCKVTVDIQKLTNFDANQQGPLTLVCHDMKGGYLDDRFSHGKVCDSMQFWLSDWWQMDIFTYFSHNLVTIPPIGWINVAHKHGVRVLGTFITEWDDGKEICAQIFGDAETSMNVAGQLAKIASKYQFDGWLVNIENVIQYEHLDNLKRFLQILTVKCKELLGRQSLVIWYDSVIASSGRLKWQDEVNALNKYAECFIDSGPFLDCCDAIFLNYGWTEASLKASKSLVGDNASKVFVGVDVFGRGCLGGGGYKCSVPAEIIAKYGFSTAIFAPGWVYETKEIEDLQRNSNKFWYLLSDFSRDRCLLDIPFKTQFKPACYKEGAGYVYNNCTQDIMPNLAFQKLVESRKPWDHHDAISYDKSGMKIKIYEEATSIRLFCLNNVTRPIWLSMNFSCTASLKIWIYLRVVLKEGVEFLMFGPATPVGMDPSNRLNMIHCGEDVNGLDKTLEAGVREGSKLGGQMTEVGLFINEAYKSELTASVLVLHSLQINEGHWSGYDEPD